MFFRRRMTCDEVKEGAVYRRLHRHNLVEQAEVVWIGTDHFGIPHVRYEVSFIGPDHAEADGVRMLALQSFAERYSPHSAAVPA